MHGSNRKSLIVAAHPAKPGLRQSSRNQTNPRSPSLSTKTSAGEPRSEPNNATSATRRASLRLTWYPELFTVEVRRPEVAGPVFRSKLRRSGRKGPKSRSAETRAGRRSGRGWGARLIPAHCHPFPSGWSAIGDETHACGACFFSSLLASKIRIDDTQARRPALLI